MLQSLSDQLRPEAIAGGWEVDEPPVDRPPQTNLWRRTDLPLTARRLLRPLVRSGDTVAGAPRHNGPVANREVDEQLAYLCHLEIAGGGEALALHIADLPREQVDRLLCLAVAEILELTDDVRDEVARLARRVQEHRDRSRPTT
jgi:hypothetical protein